MEYYKIFNMNREPFSNSPEPDFFYQSDQHLGCLQQLELAIRLRRGLNVLIGDVGTGKTTLCRELLLRFTETEEDRNEIETHLMLDPSFSTPLEFLSAVTLSLGFAVEAGESEWQIKENIKNHLFHKGVEEKKTVVLIIDEGQKLPAFCREILREFLNYETNENKLLQIVIFAQKEFREILKEHINFADRVNQYYKLEPLNYRETRDMIRFRLARAGRSAGAPLFSTLGLWEVYRVTGGYPRRIITLCHQILLALIIRSQQQAGWLLVRSVARRQESNLMRSGRWIEATITAIIFLSLVSFLFFVLEPMSMFRHSTLAVPTTTDPAKSTPSLKLAAPINPVPSVNSIAGQTQGNVASAATATVVSAKDLAATSKLVRELKVPTSLGSVNIHKGGTVYQLLLEIYGSTRMDLFQAVSRANPQIANMNWVRAGEQIAFPAVQMAAPWPQNGKRVQIASKRSLDEAYGLYKEYPGYIKILPFWNPREGMVYGLLLRDVFDNDAAMRNVIKKLPASLAANALIMEKPGADTVYFAN